MFSMMLPSTVTCSAFFNSKMFFTVHFVVTMLYGVSAHDPLTLTAVVATLTVVTIAAAAIPAFRAVSINPIDALRSE